MEFRGFTDANGLVIFDVQPGNYLVDVVPPAGYRDAPDQEVLDLKDAELRRVEFRLDKQSGKIEALFQVVDAQGNAVPVASGEIIVRAKLA